VACGEEHREAGEVRHRGDKRHLHADLGLTEEAGSAGAEVRHARNLPFDDETFLAVLAVRVGFRILARVDEERLVRADLETP
jgi:hypothetical protein